MRPTFAQVLAAAILLWSINNLNTIRKIPEMEWRIVSSEKMEEENSSAMDECNGDGNANSRMRRRKSKDSPFLLDCAAVVKSQQKKDNYYNTTYINQVRVIAQPSFTAHLHYALKDKVISTELMDKGCYECETYNALMNVLYRQDRQKTFLLDIGGNIGLFSLGAAANGYESVAVEPSLRNWAVFCHSVVANPYFDKRIRLHKVALHDKWEPTQLGFKLRNPRNPGATSVVEKVGNAQEGGGEGGEVEGIDYAVAVSIDMLDRDGHLPPPKPSVVVKVDVEGYECIALKGATNYLSKLDIVYVSIEMTTIRLRDCQNRPELFDLFTKNRLEPYIFHSHDETWKLVSVHNWTGWSTNILADSIALNNDRFDIAWSRNPPNSTPFSTPY